MEELKYHFFTLQFFLAQQVLAVVLFAQGAAATDLSNVKSSTPIVSQRTDSQNSVMQEDKDGIVDRNEYEVISSNQSILRALCPYTCERRGIPKNHCHAWRSNQDPTMCYVQDTRIESHAIEFGRGSLKNK